MLGNKICFLIPNLFLCIFFWIKLYICYRVPYNLLLVFLLQDTNFKPMHKETEIEIWSSDSSSRRMLEMVIKYLRVRDSMCILHFVHKK